MFSFHGANGPEPSMTLFRKSSPDGGTGGRQITSDWSSSSVCGTGEKVCCIRYDDEHQNTTVIVAHIRRDMIDIYYTCIHYLFIKELSNAT